MTPSAALPRLTPSPLSVFRASNFAPAFFFLPAERRLALQAVYAFCRAVDDSVDHEHDPARAKDALDEWRDLLQNPEKEPSARIDRRTWEALSAALDEYDISVRHLLDLIDGVEMDLSRRRYETFDGLLKYCYGVASTVGLACLPVFGLDETRHCSFAIHLGYAVQLTNILRDVGADAAVGRIYIPGEDIKRFNCSEEDILAGRMSPALQRLLRFEANRAREMYARALADLPASSLRAARPALIMGAVYRSLLEKIERAGFPVFGGGRVRLTAFQKLKSVGGVLWKEWVS